MGHVNATEDKDMAESFQYVVGRPTTLQYRSDADLNRDGKLDKEELKSAGIKDGIELAEEGAGS